MNRTAAALLFCLFGNDTAAATAEYQIRRLIYLNTGCGLDHLSTIESQPGQEKFRATCKNLSAYPDGLEIVCTDPFDDRSCRIMTHAKRFDQLELMQPRK